MHVEANDVFNWLGKDGGVGALEGAGQVDRPKASGDSLGNGAGDPRCPLAGRLGAGQRHQLGSHGWHHALRPFHMLQLLTAIADDGDPSHAMHHSDDRVHILGHGCKPPQPAAIRNPNPCPSRLGGGQTGRVANMAWGPGIDVSVPNKGCRDDGTAL